ncbi:MAG: EAL domain-containing protein [Lachnospiraceae bacterium]|nr:EAL domain-containing protein [Lachnospiraceae bacterium]
MDEKRDLTAYFAEHIDESAEDGEIKIFYQPIIRTLTGEVCGKEALARWVDKRYGILEPGEFIPALEEAKLIHKLDSYVINKICSHYAHCVERNDPLIPISFNLSWLDFELCDITEIINSAVEKNRVPRQMIRIEINESLIMHDKGLIKEKIAHLHDEGYEIVMDDFGGGHSSLNILKDYVFDELKIDMRLLKVDDDRSRRLVEYLFSMAKSFGIRTSAESVETREQMEFLRRTGCEKMQGFLFGEPLFYWDMIPYLREKGLSTESMGLKGYYDSIGRTDILEKRNKSYALVEFDDDRPHFLYLNEEYKRNVRSLGITDLAMLESLCNDMESALNRKFIQMIRRSKERAEEQVMDFVSAGNYCIVKFRHLAGSRNKDAYEIELVNLSMDSRVNHLQKINDALEAVFSVFNRVVQYDLSKDRVNVLHCETGFVEKYDSNSFSENINRYIQGEIYPDDRERYRQFSDIRSLKDRIGSSGRNFISACFRFKTPGGNYVWMEQYIILARGDEDGEKFLLCTMEVDEKKLALLMELSSFVSNGPDEDRLIDGKDISESVLWRTAVESCPVGLFWKDRNRRFLGVNRAFLDYYGFESEEEILGKTDEEMSWHVDPVPFKTDEENVVNNGTIIKDIVGKCIARGENRDILVNKAPVFKDGRIVGILGYFRDITEGAAKYDVLKNVSFTDPATGVLNTMGLMDAVSKYEAAYVDNQSDFAMVIFNINHYRELRKEYGHEHSDRVMEAIAKKIQKSVGASAVIGRPGTDTFLVIRQVESREEGPSLMQRIINDISSLREVNGIPCTIYCSAGYATYTEAGSSEALYSAARKRMNDQMERMRRFTGGF